MRRSRQSGTHAIEVLTVQATIGGAVLLVQLVARLAGRELSQRPAEHEPAASSGAMQVDDVIEPSRALQLAQHRPDRVMPQPALIIRTAPRRLDVNSPSTSPSHRRVRPVPLGIVQ